MNDDVNVDGVVRLSGKLLCASAEDVEIIKSHLAEHIRLSRAEPGCLSFDVWQIDKTLVWNVEESFTDSSAFNHHQKRTRASVWWTATASIPRSYKISGLVSE